MLSSGAPHRPRGSSQLQRTTCRPSLLRRLWRCLTRRPQLGTRSSTSASGPSVTKLENTRFSMEQMRHQPPRSVLGVKQDARRRQGRTHGGRGALRRLCVGLPSQHLAVCLCCDRYDFRWLGCRRHPARYGSSRASEVSHSCSFKIQGPSSARSRTTDSSTVTCQ